MKNKLVQDFNNYNINNTDEKKVLKSHYFSGYKGCFVLRFPRSSYAASYGILFIGKQVRDVNTVKHEYGHRLQMKKWGLWKYTFKIALPSLWANILDRKGKLPYDYYGSRWESEADRLGQAVRQKNNAPWPEGAYKSLWKYLF